MAATCSAVARAMLHDPSRHEALTTTPWDEARVCDAVHRIVDDIEARRQPDGSWPVHPNDDEGDTPAGGFKALYLGRAGVWWALWALQRAGAVALRSDPRAGIEQACADYAAAPDSGAVVPSYFMGEAGLQLVRWALTGAADAADRVQAAVAANVDNPTNEALWAAPGTMMAAWHLWRATGQARWRELLQANSEQVWKTWQFDDALGCHLWTQDLYGKTVQYYGAGHGFAGNACALLTCADLIDAPRRDALYERSLATLRTLACREGDAVNWLPGNYTPRPGAPRFLMQWCHGAPGIVTSLAPYPVGRSPEMEALLRGGAQAVWQAGPLAKGPGLCHGTAGNGFAFLKLYRRSGDAVWLERARAFAMHALEQCDRLRRQHGQGRYTLWTGDAGVALYLWACLNGQAELPTWDAVA